MTLSIANQKLLRAQYDKLIDYLIEEKQALWLPRKESIIKFCIENEIPLYNIGSLRELDASILLGELVDHFSLLDLLGPEDLALWKAEALQWKTRFQAGMEQARLNLFAMHHQAYLSVADQYLKTGAVSPRTLLTIKDMSDLLADANFESEYLLLSEPFSLTEKSLEQEERIQNLLLKDLDNEKEIFLPVTHDGHWFYLSKKEGVWSVEDSQPVNGELSPRQKSIIEESEILLTKLTGKDVKVAFETSGEQLNNYDCGTRVVHAYRKKVNEHDHTQNYTDILIECLSKQLSQEQFEHLPRSLFGDEVEYEIDPEEVEINEELTAQEMQIIETTTSSQREPEKSALYKATLNELVKAVNKKGFFAQVDNKIPVNAINSAKAEHGESDEDFAIRLQEAEFRKAGLK